MTRIHCATLALAFCWIWRAAVASESLEVILGLAQTLATICINNACIALLYSSCGNLGLPSCFGTSTPGYKGMAPTTIATSVLDNEYMFRLHKLSFDCQVLVLLSNAFMQVKWNSSGPLNATVVSDVFNVIEVCYGQTFKNH
jgi:hypothetical protein